jgi:hypothetical protein
VTRISRALTGVGSMNKIDAASTESTNRRRTVAAPDTARGDDAVQPRHGQFAALYVAAHHQRS